jgi:restriction system protein
MDGIPDMSTDPAFHFPPDVFNAVVDAVPLLTRSRMDAVLFFKGCGVDRKILVSLSERVRTDSGFSKYHVTKEVLTFLNEQGDAGLGARRQVLRRVSEFDDFGSCYPDNQLKAKGAVATVAELINKKDSFTRLQQTHDAEQKRQQEVSQRQAEEGAARREAIGHVRTDLFALFSESSPQRRGKALEDVLNRLFKSHGILVREAFVVVDSGGAGVIEQIDGAVEIDSRLYLVEMKWWSEPLGRHEVASHLVSVYGRGDAGGILISKSGYHPSAIADCTTALAQRTVVLVELEEIVKALDRGVPLLDLLRPKIREATLSKRPLTRPLDD